MAIDILKPLKDLFIWLIDQMVSFAKRIYDIAKKLVEWIANIISDALAPLGDKVLSMIDSIRTEIYKENFRGAVKKALEFTLFALGVVSIVDLLQTKFMGFGLELRAVSNIFHSILKADLFFSAVVGALVGSGVHAPAQYLANRLLKPKMLTLQEAIQCYSEKAISLNELKKYISFEGYDPAFTPLLLTAYDWNPSTAELSRWAMATDIPDNVIDKALDEMRVYDKDYRNYIKLSIKYRAYRDELSKLDSVLRTVYQNGMITKSDLQKQLKELKATAMEQNLFITSCEWLKTKTLIDKEVNTQMYYYRNGLIDEDTFYKNLLNIGITYDVANAIVRLEAAKRGKEWIAPK